MSWSVKSYSTVATNDSNGLTITKPTGVAAGDLLLLIGKAYSTGSISSSGFTSSKEIVHTISGDSAERQSSTRILYKIADSGDEAASNYSITYSGGSDDMGVAVMLCIEGWVSGDPVYASSDFKIVLPSTYSSGTVSQSGLSIIRPNSSLVILGIGAQSSDGGTTEFSVSDFTVTSGESNPTWTSVIDAEASTNGGSDPSTTHLAVAYATSSDTSTVTGYSAVLTETQTSGFGLIGFLLVLIVPTNATGTPPLFSASPTFFTVAGLVGGSVVLPITTSSTTTFSVTGSSNSAHIWTTLNKQ